jgi:peptide/nickel transport system substrate-binding protein
MVTIDLYWEVLMDEQTLRELIKHVKSGRLSRRLFVQTLVGFGLTGPLAMQLLTPRATRAQPRISGFTPTRRGGGGLVRLLYWAAPTLLNPHIALGPNDFEASEIFYEPLADIAADGTIVPVLATEVPSVDNGGVARDGTSVVWRLKPGVLWHDGRPFTADDVIFTWEYAADPATTATTAGSYRNIERIERPSDHEVKLVFKGPTPFWADAFCSNAGMILPRHVFESYRGTRSREAPANLAPIGTGPYRYVDFKPRDLLRAEINLGYHVPKRPFFDTLELKGGGDATSAARAVLQTGEYDYAWGVTVEDDILRRLEEGGKGRVVLGRTANPVHIQLNQTDPWTEVDGERSSVQTVHPFLTDLAVRSALALLVDRRAIQTHIFGRLAEATANFLSGPPQFVSPNTRWEFSVDQANQRLDAGGWQRGPDGIRAKDGKRLKLLFQAQTLTLFQKSQAVVKQACAKAGIELELKSVVGSVFQSSDPSNPDTAAHFYADLQLLGRILRHPDPQAFMREFCSWEVAQKANMWTGPNIVRWRNDEYDQLWRTAEHEMDPVKRAALFIRMNDLVVDNVVVIPIVTRTAAFAVAKMLQGFDFSPYSGPLWRLVYWYRQA